MRSQEQSAKSMGQMARSIWGKLINRAPALNPSPFALGSSPSALGSSLASGAAGDLVRAANTWRDSYNPLRSLTMAVAISRLEQGQQGIFADLQWTYSFIERRDPDLLAIVERRTGAIQEMDWTCKPITAEKLPAGATPAEADAQASALKAAYEKIDNLYEALEHLTLAAFRGYAHLQLQTRQNGQAISTAIPGVANHLEPLDQWNIARQGRLGPWFWNPQAQATSTLDPKNQLDPQWFIIREAKRPIDEIGLIKYLRSNLCEKDWDGFVEIYGIPGWIVIMPPNIPTGKESDYETAATAVAEGGSGSLPNGADAKCSDSPRGIQPFSPRLQYLSEKLVLAGTGGLLTMLTAPGSGTLAGSAHQEAFQIIARSDARRISELLQEQFDKRFLAQAFPGRPVLAYFDLAAREEKDIGGIIDHAVKLSSAGFQMDAAELSEKTGYRLTLKPAAIPAMGFANRLRNRSGSLPSALSPLLASARLQLSEAQATVLAPLRARLEQILQSAESKAQSASESGPMPQALSAMLAKLSGELPAMLRDLNADPATAKVLEETFSAALASGLSVGSPLAGDPKPLQNSFDPSQPRDEQGRWSEAGGGEITWKTPKGTEFRTQGEKLIATKPDGKVVEILWQGDEPAHPLIHETLKKAGMNPADYRSAKGNAAVLFPKADSDRLTEVSRRTGLARAKREEAFKTQFPGHEEISAEEAASEEHAYRVKQALERGDGRLPAPRNSNLADLQQKYPRAAALRKVESWRGSANDLRSSAAATAEKRLHAGEDHMKVLREMEEEWSRAAERAVLNQ